ncbi:uncharacterized protein [Lolium perenne]|uniref:uncharacterized protein n=1 Tax=Lolium perenne TaxID=4522 RepID=UPI0021F6313F|nr:uncharacterized protein LOC127342256 [Lolium perenne]
MATEPKAPPLPSPPPAAGARSYPATSPHPRPHRPLPKPLPYPVVPSRPHRSLPDRIADRIAPVKTRCSRSRRFATGGVSCSRSKNLSPWSDIIGARCDSGTSSNNQNSCKFRN